MARACPRGPERKSKNAARPGTSGPAQALLEWTNALLILAFMQIDGLKCYPDIADVQDGVVVAAPALGEALLPRRASKCGRCGQPKKGHVCPHA